MRARRYATVLHGQVVQANGAAKGLFDIIQGPLKQQCSGKMQLQIPEAVEFCEAFAPQLLPQVSAVFGGGPDGPHFDLLLRSSLRDALHARRQCRAPAFAAASLIQTPPLCQALPERAEVPPLAAQMSSSEPLRL